MRRDAVVTEPSYNEQDPALVARAIDANYAKLSDLLHKVSEADWQRVGVRQGEELSVAWMAVKTLHEARHHLLDVDGALAAKGVDGTD